MVIARFVSAPAITATAHTGSIGNSAMRWLGPATHFAAFFEFGLRTVTGHRRRPGDS
jgi:hypothetical protein